MNDNWRTGGQEAEIIASTVPPTNDLESAIVATLPANSAAYTAIVRGVGNTTGVGLVEVYDLDRDGRFAAGQHLHPRPRANGRQRHDWRHHPGGTRIAPRDRARDRALVAGERQAGRSDPHDRQSERNLLCRRTTTGGRRQEAEIIATTVPPTNDLESAIVATLPAAPYTAIVRGKERNDRRSLGGSLCLE